MYAVVEIAGFQYKVSPDMLIKVPKLEGKDGDTIRLDNVLAISDENKTEIGKPYLDDVYVKAKIIAFGKYPKLLVYKYKKRKKYRRMKGHRQDYTEIMITDIGKQIPNPKS